MVTESEPEVIAAEAALAVFCVAAKVFAVRRAYLLPVRNTAMASATPLITAGGAA